LQPVSDLTGHLYEAALNPALWPTAIEAATLRFKASKAIVYSLDLSPAAGGFLSTVNIPEESLDCYWKSYRHGDLWIKGHEERFDGRPGTYLGNALTDYRVVERTSFYDGFMKPYDLYHLCTSGVESTPNAKGLVSFAMFRGRRESNFDAADLRLSEQLAPHLQRSLAIGHRFRECDLSRKIDLAMLDGAPSPIFLVDAVARVRRMTRAAESFASKATHLAIRGGRLSCPHDNRLSEAISSVLNARSHSRVLDVYDAQGVSRIHVLVSGAGRDLPGMAYVAVGTVGAIQDIGPGRLRALYNLTPAELRLCEHLLQGHSLAEAAELLAVKVSTATSQIKSCLAKTGTRRQSDLMRLLIDVGSLT
jgi:DNA-binding CsgD family transcriptional regulator